MDPKEVEAGDEEILRRYLARHVVLKVLDRRQVDIQQLRRWLFSSDNFWKQTSATETVHRKGATLVGLGASYDGTPLGWLEGVPLSQKSGKRNWYQDADVELILIDAPLQHFSINCRMSSLTRMKKSHRSRYVL